MSIGKNNPFLTVNVLILDALVDGVQRPSENGISDVMGIIQKLDRIRRMLSMVTLLDLR